VRSSLDAPKFSILALISSLISLGFNCILFSEP
jgi:hypothetical protein